MTLRSPDLTVRVFQFYPVNPSTPMRDQDRTSPLN